MMQTTGGSPDGRLLHNRLNDDDRGAVAVLVAASMILLLGFAALAIDIGAGYNERRADQTAADTGVMSGAVYMADGISAARTNLLNLIQTNLPNTYTPSEWQTMWENCVDPASDRNFGGHVFTPIAAPSGWVPVDSANWCISGSSDLLRVRLPDQLVDTTFGQIVGVSELQTGAFAVARIGFGGGAGGILPFGLTAGAEGHVCLSSGPTGQAVSPCDGSTSGNFGTLLGFKYGNPELGTFMNCGANPGNLLAQNIAHGYDHIVTVHPDNPSVSTANEVVEFCTASPSPRIAPFPNALNTDTGFPNNGAEEGLVGPVPQVPGEPTWSPRLSQSPSRDTVFGGYQVDNRPLWSYLRNGVSGAPAICARSTFNPATSQDWDGDGNDESDASWQHMEACLDEYLANGHTQVIFQDTLGDNAARFSYVPEFWESSLGSGGSATPHIRLFRAVYLQSTTWKQGNSYLFHNPGEGCLDGSGVSASCTGNYSMRELTAFIIPDSALPAALRGSNPPGGGSGLNPFEAELFR